MTSRSLRRGVFFGLSIFFCYIVFCQFFFVTHAIGGVFRGLSSFVLIPAMSADGQRVSYRYVAEMAHGVQGFGGVTERDQAFDRALSVSAYRLYIEELAREFDVKVTKDEVAAYAVNFDDIAVGLETAKWEEKDYRKYMVEPLLLAQITEAAVSASDDYQADALETMESLRKKVAQGMPFADVAQNFSQDPSALSRGDLGMMSVGDLPAWLEPALALEPGDISEVLSAPDAYWMVTMLEYYPSEVPDQAAVHFRGIAVKKKSFGAIIGDAMSENPPWVFVW